MAQYHHKWKKSEAKELGAEGCKMRIIQLNIAAFEDAREPIAKECRQPRVTPEGKKIFFLRDHRKECSPKNISNFIPTRPMRISDFQDHEINLYCFQSIVLWQFVKAAKENQKRSPVTFLSLSSVEFYAAIMRQMCCCK